MTQVQTFQPAEWLIQLRLPQPDSHKGQNGKLLLIGGSSLFHAASKWSLDIASKFVDMVFYASTPENNVLIQQAKGSFWNGIVIAQSQIETYAQEADVILIGPGMERVEETAALTDKLLDLFPTKKWVIDAGALQMVDPAKLTSNCICTPHHHELQQLALKLFPTQTTSELTTPELLALLAPTYTVLCKGQIDYAWHQNQLWSISGGNAGMTKGGTGDVLAGLIAALYCQQDALVATLLGSYSNKKTGEYLQQQVGPFFNASDLVQTLPQVLWDEYQKAVALNPSNPS